MEQNILYLWTDFFTKILIIHQKTERIMTYNVIQIEGVGEVYAEKLAAAGIKTTDDLLAKCATAVLR